MSELLKGEGNKVRENDFINRLASLGRKPEAGERPARARAIIINPAGTKFIGILRKRVDSEPYIVFPGGGLENSDPSVVDGVEREVTEELTNVRPGDVTYDENVLEFDDQFYLIGIIKNEEVDFIMGGPEKDRDPATHGTYHPGWYPISEISTLNVVPKEVSAKLTQAYRQLQE